MARAQQMPAATGRPRSSRINCRATNPMQMMENCPSAKQLLLPAIAPPDTAAMAATGIPQGRNLRHPHAPMTPRDRADTISMITLP